MTRLLVCSAQNAIACPPNHTATRETMLSNCGLAMQRNGTPEWQRSRQAVSVRQKPDKTRLHGVFYHRHDIVWSTKYRCKVFTGDVRLWVRDICRQACRGRCHVGTVAGLKKRITHIACFFGNLRGANHSQIVKVQTLLGPRSFRFSQVSLLSKASVKKLLIKENP